VKKTLKQLKEERQISLDEMTALINLSETEDRNLSTDEQSSFDKVELNVEDLGTRIDRLERSMKLASANPVSFETQDVKKADKNLQRFSFAEAARQAYTGNLSGVVREMDEEARHESPGQAFRGVGIPISVLTRAATDLPAATAKARGTEVGSIIDQLQANSVLVGAGANFMTGLSSDRKFPIIGDIASSFVREIGYTGASGTGVVAESGSIDELTLSPKKIISLVQMSAELMQQNAAVEGALQANMAASIMAAFEKALLQNAATTTNGPDSILSDAASDGVGAVSIATLATMEAKLLGQNINQATARTAYIFNGNGFGAARTAAGSNFVNGFFDPINRTLNGHKYFVTTNLNAGGGATKDAALFGAFDHLHIGQFGGMDIVYDPFTLGGRGIGRIIVTTLMDGKADNGGSVFRKTIEA
jgi:HK97 family phage major capsid protein|tara:strand:+ start:977 stop:2233 length:1257 start_codon:yes stop_codon:yes gene_type:complete